MNKIQFTVYIPTTHLAQAAKVCESKFKLTIRSRNQLVAKCVEIVSSFNDSEKLKSEADSVNFLKKRGLLGRSDTTHQVREEQNSHLKDVEKDSETSDKTVDLERSKMKKAGLEEAEINEIMEELYGN